MTTLSMRGTYIYNIITDFKFSLIFRNTEFAVLNVDEIWRT